jgi:hypothetical protein
LQHRAFAKYEGPGNEHLDKKFCIGNSASNLLFEWLEPQ